MSNRIKCSDEDIRKALNEGKSKRWINKNLRACYRRIGRIIEGRERNNGHNSYSFTKRELSDLYQKQKLSIYEISVILECSPMTVYNSLIRLEIPIRGKMEYPREDRREIWGSHKENHWRWKGGDTKVFCVICGGENHVPPYIYREIQSEERVPTCSHECTLIYARSRQTNKATSIEIKMEDELRERQIPYVKQYNIGVFRSDFYLPTYNIVIECDGDYWHNRPDTKERDKRKNKYIKSKGYTLFRFWEHEINEDIAKCVDTLSLKMDKNDLKIS